MKKRFILVGMITALGLGTFFASCKKDDDKLPTCKCTHYDYDGTKETDTVDLNSKEAKEEGLKTCSDVEDYFEEDYYDIQCK